MATKSFKKDLIFTSEAANNFFKIIYKKTTKKIWLQMLKKYKVVKE